MALQYSRVSVVVLVLLVCVCSAQFNPQNSQQWLVPVLPGQVNTQVSSSNAVIKRLPQQQLLQTPLPYQVAEVAASQNLFQRPPPPPVAASYPLAPAGQLVVSKFLQPLYQAPQSQQVVNGPIKSPEVVPTRLQVQSVSAECQESFVQVAVQRDLFGIGQLIDPSDITLGGCASTGQDPSGQVLLFHAELQGCGSTLMMTEDTLVYTFTLVYTPRELGPGAPILRTNGAAVNIACHYLRKQNVSSNALMPTWVPFLTTLSAVDQLVFTLQLMTDDWKAERASNVYNLGDLVNIEAAVLVSNHVPLRVFVDSCIATMVPDVTAVPSYTFVNNHGCLIDAKLTGSHSQFMPRTQDDKLQMQLEAFRFSQQTNTTMYITCLLKATVASAVMDMEYKACSFSTVANRWVAAVGDNQVCACCDSTCSFRKGRSLDDMAPQWQEEVVLRPFNVLGKPLLLDVKAQAQTSATDAVEPGFSAEMVALAGMVAAVALICVVVLGAVIHWK